MSLFPVKQEAYCEQKEKRLLNDLWTGTHVSLPLACSIWVARYLHRYGKSGGVCSRRRLDHRPRLAAADGAPPGATLVRPFDGIAAGSGVAGGVGLFDETK